MRQRQRQVRRPAVEWLSRVRVQAVQKQSKKCLGDQLIDGSERGTEGDAKIVQVCRVLEDWFDSLPAVRLRDLDARCGRRRRGP